MPATVPHVGDTAEIKQTRMPTVMELTCQCVEIRINKIRKNYRMLATSCFMYHNLYLGRDLIRKNNSITVK